MYIYGHLEALSRRGLYFRNFRRKGGVASCNFAPLSLRFINSPNVEKNSALETSCLPDNVPPQPVILIFEGGLGRLEKTLKIASC